MRKIVIFSLLFAMAAMLSAASVTMNEAHQVAQLKLQIAERNDHQIVDSQVISTEAGLEIAYLFTLSPEGFILVSTDSDIKPIIGYSFENEFITTVSVRNVALHMISHDQTNRHEVLDQISNEMRSDNNNLWNAYLTNDLNQLITRDPVWPPENYASPNDGWMHTEWAQSSPYFNFCPLDNAENGRSVVGCVATAASQVIYYHKNFEQPNFTDSDDYWSGYDPYYVYIDDHSVSNEFPSFPELNTYLQTAEEHLENGTAYTNDDYAALCFAFGISVDMNYGSSASGGSGAYSFSVNGALTDRWGFENADYYQTWSTAIKNIMIDNMENGLPGLLGIIQSGAPYGHSIVYDGYNQNDDTFHLNYGWSGNSNGWYNIPAGMPQFDTINGVTANIDDGYDTFDLTGNINAEGNSVDELTFTISQNDYVIEVTPDADGDFEVPYILGGTYLVEATLELETGGYYYYSQEMSLTAANGYISISMLPFTNFSGTISADTATEGATVAIYQNGHVIRTTTVDAAGNYSTAGLLPGTYAVTASMTGNYFGATAVEVTFATQDADITMTPYPYDFTINLAGEPTDVYTFVPFTLSIGIQITGESLAPYANDVFTKVRFKSPADPANAELWAQLWEDNVLLSETAVIDFTYGEWVTVELDNYVEIDPSKIYYAGYKTISSDGVMAWHDNGPRVEGGAFTRNTGWMQLPTSNDYNFNIIAITMSETLSGEETELVAMTNLNNNYPNPFNPTTTISYNLADDGNVSLEVYNVKGQKVKSLLNAKQTSGEHSVVWNGKDDGGKNLTSGVYFYKLQSGDYISTKKMLLLK